MHHTMSLEDRIMKARVRLVVSNPFFGTLLFRMKLVEVAKGTMRHDTMATDGRHIFYVREYVDKLDDPNLTGLLAHEVMHVALLHSTRRNLRDPDKWNIACDGAIDHMLKDAGMKVPDSFADNPRLAWMKDKSADEIYHLLPDNEDGGGGGEPGEPGGGRQPRAGGVLDSPASNNPALKTQEEQEIRISVAQAAIAAKAKGNLPAWMKHLIDELNAPVVSWKDHLRVFVANHVPTGQTWARPNRRFAHTGLFLPGTLKEGVGEGAILFDTSGSTYDWWGQFLSECKSILEDVQPPRVHILQCDAGVGDFHTYEQGEDIDAAVTGGGGSDFRPAFQAIEEANLQLKWAVVLSDMMIDFPANPPEYPVLMFSTTQHNGPDWAPTIRITK